MFLKNSENDDDDPVVQEMDVYLSKTLQNVYLLQYPIRPKYSDFEETNFIRTRIKPIQKTVEMELQVDTEGSTYDIRRGEEIARQTDSKSKENEKYFSSDLMDKQILRSVKTVPNTCLYAVGCIKDGEIHITPLQSLIQLRPTFEYLDRGESKRNDGKKGDGSSDEEEITHQVTVKFANSDKDKVKKMSEKSFRHHQQMMDDERWIDVVFNKNQSAASKFGRKSLIYNQVDHFDVNLCTASNDYMKVLLPKEKDNEGSCQPKPETFSLLQLRSLPLGDQINAILKNSQVIDFRKLLSLLSADIDPEVVLRLVQDVAVLVQGCWVIKSDRLYPKEIRGSQREVNNEVLIRCRDYVMWKFTNNRFVNRKEMAAATKIPADDLKEILEHLAICRFSQGWEFLLPTDSVFIEKFSQIVERQQKLWDLRSKKLTLIGKENDKKTSIKSPQPRRSKSQRDSESERTEDPKEIEKEVEQTQSELEELDSIVRGTLNTNYSLSLSNLKRLITQKISSTPNSNLKNKITDKQLTKAVESVGANVLNVKWPNDGQPEPLCVLTTRGDSNDSSRCGLVEMFKSNSRYRKKTIHKKLEDELKISIGEPDLGDLLRDYCANRNGWYYLKGIL